MTNGPFLLRQGWRRIFSSSFSEYTVHFHTISTPEYAERTYAEAKFVLRVSVYSVNAGVKPQQRTDVGLLSLPETASADPPVCLNVSSFRLFYFRAGRLGSLSSRADFSEWLRREVFGERDLMTCVGFKLMQFNGTDLVEDGFSRSGVVAAEQVILAKANISPPPPYIRCVLRRCAPIDPKPVVADPVKTEVVPRVERDAFSMVLLRSCSHVVKKYDLMVEV